MKGGYALAAVAGTALTLVYARSVWVVVAGGFLPAAGSFQVGMILLQTIKLGVIVSSRRLREANMVLIFDIFSVELLALPLLVLVNLLTGDSSVTAAEYGLFSTWPLALALVFVPFATFRVVRGMMRDEFPSSVIPSAVLASGLAAFSAQVATTAAARLGTADFTKALVGGFISTAGAITSVNLDPVIAGALPALYLVLVVYAAVGRTPPGSSFFPALVIALVSAFLVLLWTVSVVSMPGAIALFAVPTFGVLALVWWTGRGE